MASQTGPSETAKVLTTPLCNPTMIGERIIVKTGSDKLKEGLDMVENITVQLPSGAQWPFTAYLAGSALPRMPGVYLLLRKTVQNWSILYVGEAVDLNGRAGTCLLSHEKHLPAKRLGLSHVAVLPLQPAQAHQRMTLEKLLCSAFNPPLNKQLVA